MIHVSSHDIAVGQRRSSNLCPVAIALRRQTGIGWSVGLGSATRDFAGYARTVYLPRIVWRFISDFDVGVQVSPFIFHFDNPEC